jgi:hypothetical protein
VEQVLKSEISEKDAKKQVCYSVFGISVVWIPESGQIQIVKLVYTVICHFVVLISPVLVTSNLYCSSGLHVILCAKSL